jgi:hypothetical protein
VRDSTGQLQFLRRLRVIDDRPRRGDRRGVFLYGIQLLGGPGTHRQRFLVRGELFAEAQGAGDAGAMPVHLVDAVQGLFVLIVRQQCGIAGFGGFLMLAVIVGGALVLRRRKTVLSGACQQLGVEEIHIGRLLAVRKSAQVQLVPVSRLGVGGRFVLRLGHGMVVVRHIAQVALHLGEHFG